MAERVPFIDRENELAKIKQLILEQDVRSTLCIQALGGIGKTRLLQEVKKRYAHCALITDILDFDDLSLRVPGNIEFALSKQIGQNKFEFYLQSLQEYYQSGQLPQKKQQVHFAFANDFNKFSAQQRVVVLLDTTDTLEGTETWNYIVNELPQRLKNVILIVAGRNAEQLHQEFQSKIGKNAHSVELLPLDNEASELYLSQKQVLLHVTLEPKLAKKVSLLAGGRPILIDLTVEWLARKIPLDWLIESNLEKLESLPQDEMWRRQTEFECQLVLHIAEIRRPMDRLTLVMSHVYPLNAEMITKLLMITEDEASKLFEEAKSYVFVKVLPDGRISLHDEMRRMINDHVWPQRDPDRSRRCRDSKLAVAYLSDQIRFLREEIEQLEEKDKQRQYPQKSIVVDSFSEREGLKQKLWTLEAQALYHWMYLDSNQGFAKYDTLFQDAFHRRDSDFCIMLREIANAKAHRDSLSQENKIKLALSKAQIELLKGDFKEAEKIIQDILKEFQESDVRALGRVHNYLGYCYRLQGKWESAIESYEQALHYSDVEHDTRQIAETMNNIANVCRLSGDFERAMRYNKIGLKIREKLGGQSFIANSCYVRGMLMWEIGDPAEAVSYLERARNLYKELDDPVRAAWVDKYTGRFHYRVGDVETATEYLQKAEAIFRERGIKSELADTLNILSRVVRYSNVTGRAEEAIFHEAERYALEGLKIAQEIGDLYEIAECRLTLCILYYRWGGEYFQTGRRHEQVDKYHALARQHHEEGFLIANQYDYVDLLSVYHAMAGNMAYDEGMLAYNNNDVATATRKWDEAFRHYLEECHISAKYKEMRFDRALGAVAPRLMKLPAPDLTHKYCNEMMYHWRKRGLEHHYPQLIAECKQIKVFLDAPEKSAVDQLAQTQVDLFTASDLQGTLDAGHRVLEQNRVYLRNSQVVRALNRNAFALRQMGRFSEARRLCTTSLHIGESIQDKAAIAESYYVMGAIEWIVGNTAESATHLRQARERFEEMKTRKQSEEMEDCAGIARVRRYEGFLYFRVGNLDKALELLEEAGNCFEQCGLLADLADVLIVKSRVLREQTGQRTEPALYEAAEQATRRSNEIARQIGDNYVIAETLINLYTIYHWREQAARQAGDTEAAARILAQSHVYFQEGYNIVRKYGYSLLNSVYEKLAGDAAFEAGKLGQAFEHYVAALEHGAKFRYGRLHNVLDECIDRLASLSADQIRYYADYVIREWNNRDLAARFPDVINMFALAKEYRDYV